MSLTSEDRAALLALTHELGPAGRRDAFLATARAMGEPVLGEIGALPGHDALRAALVRVLGDLASGERAAELARAAADALRAYPEMARGEDPMLSLVRHPAWVGLCWIELGPWLDLSASAAIDRAVRLARTGFDGMGRTGTGEILWAMAEAAEETGWTDRAAALLEAAQEAAFDDERNRADVRLLLALRWAEDGDSRATALLTAIGDGAGTTQQRVHALWVLAAVARDADPARSGDALRQAAALLDADPPEDARVRARIDEALAALPRGSTA